MEELSKHMELPQSWASSPASRSEPEYLQCTRVTSHKMSFHVRCTLVSLILAVSMFARSWIKCLPITVLTLNHVCLCLFCCSMDVSMKSLLQLLQSSFSLIVVYQCPKLSSRGNLFNITVNRCVTTAPTAVSLVIHYFRVKKLPPLGLAW